MITEQTFTIKQTAELTGLSEDTIRYYEKINLLPQADRKDNGHRVYHQKDINTIRLIVCLKKTGISLEAMKPFLKVSADADPAEHLELVEELRSQRDNIVSQISSLQQIVDFIDIKLEEGRPRGECSDQTPDGVQEEFKETKTKPISVVEMSYFSASAKTGKLPNAIK
ncbi:MerR family transcriptional regulator [Paenibacillus sp. FSL L8-0436]|uniref:MerR family transcriptional regulator n=1 Tax=Paenibacillus sp. FSL L8-0436 TaxID=2954686 RepID=UPI0031592674